MNEKILVVDDIDNIAFIIKTILSREGYDVSTAYDYYGAREEMAKTDFDLVLTDIELGEDKTGIDILKEVKKTNLTCPVILNTGNPGIITESEAKRMGAYDYMSKPVKQKKLLHRVRMALRHKTIPDDNAYAGVIGKGTKLKV